jgi:hypothetical protein
MSKLIVTSDKHNLGPEQYSFLIFDLETNGVVGKAPYTKLLDADIPINAGREPFRPFGITQSEDHIFISSNSNIARFDNKTLEPIDLVSDTGVINTHQIAYYQGYLYRTNTSNDTITRIDLNTLEEIHFSFKTMSMIDKIDKPNNHRENNSYHINSLLVYQDHIYFIAHNNNIRNSYLFKLTLDFKAAKHIASLERSHHEIVIHDGFLYSLATATGKLIRLDLDSYRQEKYFLVDPIFPQGIPGALTPHTLPPGAMFLRGMEFIDNKLEIFANSTFDVGSDNYATRITFDVNDYSIIRKPVQDLSIVSCVQEYRGV